MGSASFGTVGNDGSADNIIDTVNTNGTSITFDGDTLEVGEVFTTKLLDATWTYLGTDGDGGIIGAATLGDIIIPGNKIYLTDKDLSPGDKIPEFKKVDFVPCFVAGTLIATPDGDVPVEFLKAGDLVLTRDHGAQEVRWTGTRRVAGLGASTPVLIDAGVLGNRRALRVSPTHRMVISGPRAAALFGAEEVLVCAKDLIGLEGVRRAGCGAVDYVHVLFDRHQIIFAEGAPSESLNPSNTMLDDLGKQSRDEILSLFPELKAGAYSPLARPALSRRDADVLLHT